MHKIATTGAAAGASNITISTDEITSIFNQLQAIITELDSNVTPNIKKLGELNFYQDGKAKKAMAAYAEANEKMLDLHDNYVRASSLVIEVLNKMMETDQAIAQQIIAKLEV
ncbi:hypothetical protein GMD78_04135 [Ornithinibacillus sp. L9]|uniref:Uncharacterized protein n=1 Tax=Ornithinibacillus caprae TaxID=2678566 RepID=A0A6N8FIK2_9BACI|nr:hypothetical protein [Ornithinibacillus caprae]MUK87589.1 hypothetical protein [Ornithinibacillus caprae]